MVIIGVASNVTLGFASRRFNSLMLLIVPLTVSISFFLISDIDSPRGGLVKVAPQNLHRLVASLNEQ
jgi:hypothetical protein